MNKFWTITVLISATILTLRSPDTLLSGIQNGATSAIALSLTLLPSYAVWGGVLETASRSGIENALIRLMHPVTRKLFSKEREDVQRAISMTFVANIIGLGGVATPLAINATSMMDDGTYVATKSQVLFTVINATSISLVPTTVLSILTSHGSKMAGSIILPTLLVSTVATVIAVIAVGLLKK